MLRDAAGTRHNGTMRQPPNQPRAYAPPPRRGRRQAPFAPPPSPAPLASGTPFSSGTPGAPYTPGTPGASRLPLLRPRHGRMLFGVCRGVALHLNWSVWLVRLLFVALAFAFGAGAVIYLFLWLFVPAGDPVAVARMQAAQAASQANAPLARGNAPYADSTHDGGQSADGQTALPTSENLIDTLKHAPRPALFALAGVIMLLIATMLLASGIELSLIIPLMLAAGGIAVAWSRFDAKDGQLWSMVGGVALLFAAYAFYVSASWWRWESVTPRLLISGMALLVGVGLAIVPWITSLVRDIGTERALKEREEERADMTAHLHDGVLQTLALIQLHSEEAATVFTLARQQERELREWLYQERTTSDRSVSAGLKDIAAQVEDEHGRPVEVVTVGDARPSAQTDALLDATRQALINAVTHGGEPVSVYCEAGDTQVEVFVRDHGDGFDTKAIPEGRLGIRESIIGRIRRRGGTVEIVSRPGWGTEVRMHMPIAAEHDIVKE